MVSLRLSWDLDRDEGLPSALCLIIGTSCICKAHKTCCRPVVYPKCLFLTISCLNHVSSRASFPVGIKVIFQADCERVGNAACQACPHTKLSLTHCLIGNLSLVGLCTEVAWVATSFSWACLVVVKHPWTHLSAASGQAIHFLLSVKF